MLNKLGILSGRETISGDLFMSLFPNFMDIKYDSPSNYVSTLWKTYKGYNETNNSLNGHIFELIIITLCIREELLPLYRNAKVAFVPNVSFDILFYTKQKGPVCLSLKTSLRERYKQADLESIALKSVHRRSLCYLITLDGKAAEVGKKRIESGDVIGLNDFINAGAVEFDTLISDLKKYQLATPPTFKVFESNHITTIAKVNAILSDRS